MLETVDFNYFYFEFVRETQSKMFSREKLLSINKDENSQIISIFNSVLWDICVDYISLDELDITVLPVDVFELLKMILDCPSKGNNRRSFLLSLQFILVRYFVVLGYGDPILMMSQSDNENPVLELEFDDDLRIDKLSGINITEEEMTRLMINMVMLLKEKMYGPYEMTRIRTHNSI